MPADPFVHITPADRQLIEKARKRGPKALSRVVHAIGRRAIATAKLKDEQRERELLDLEDRAWPPSMLQARK